MRIHIKGGENIVDVLRTIADYFEKQKNKRIYIGNVGANFYFDLYSAENVPNEMNKGNLVMKDGQIFDFRDKVNEFAINICKQTMLNIISYKIDYLTVGLDKDIQKNLLIKEKSIVRARETTVETTRKRNLTYIKKAESALEDLEEIKAKSSSLIKFYNDIKYCIDNSKVKWELIYVYGKSEYNIQNIFVRPMIDKECVVFEKPLFFYRDGRSYSFSYECIDDYRNWISMENRYGGSSLMRHIYAEMNTSK